MNPGKRTLLALSILLAGLGAALPFQKRSVHDFPEGSPAGFFRLHGDSLRPPAGASTQTDPIHAHDLRDVDPETRLVGGAESEDDSSRGAARVPDEEDAAAISVSGAQSALREGERMPQEAQITMVLADSLPPPELPRDYPQLTAPPADAADAAPGAWPEPAPPPALDELPAAPSQSALEAPALRVHRIRDGDTLEKLARRHLGSAERADEIFALNRQALARPDLLPIGVEIRIPSR